MPREKERPRQPEVATPPIPSPGAMEARPRRAGHRILADGEVQGRGPGPERDVAAVVHMRAGQTVTGGQHGGEDVVRDRPGDGGHRGDEGRGKAVGGGLHAPRDRAGQVGTVGRAQAGEFRDQPVEHGEKGIAGAGQGGASGVGGTFGGDDQVDRPVGQAQPSVGHQSGRGGFLPAHDAPSFRPTGQGAPGLRDSDRRPDRR